MSSLTREEERKEDALARKIRTQGDLQFTALSQRFHFTPATELTTPHDPRHPKLILIFGWLGARLRHIQKYANGYHKLYPSSPIIIVRSFHPDMTPFSKFAREFTALKVLLQLHNVDLMKDGNGTLIQALSNGGCWSLSALMNKLHHNAIIRPRTIIFDSCPGRARYRTFMQAFIHAGNLGLFGKALYTPLVTFFYFFYKWLCRIRGQDPFGERRRTMTFNVISESRLYIYSRRDKLIHWPHIQEHAESVQQYHRGQELVQIEEFQGEHVQHLRADEERYWDVVQQAWDPEGQVERRVIKAPEPVLTETPPEEEEDEASELTQGSEARS